MGKNHPHKPHRHTEESRKKISQADKGKAKPPRSSHTKQPKPPKDPLADLRLQVQQLRLQNELARLQNLSLTTVNDSLAKMV
jgi:hypothetical protein